MKERVGALGLLRRTGHNLVAIADQLPDLPLLAARLLSDLERYHQEGLGGAAQGGPSDSDNRCLAGSLKAIAGATFALCGTLVLVLGPGPWLPEQWAVALVVASYTGGSWLFLSASR